jgi:hypothetical protein
VGRRGLRGRDGGDDLPNVQCKPIQTVTMNAPLYNKYILIKKLINKKKLKKKKNREDLNQRF